MWSMRGEAGVGAASAPPSSVTKSASKRRARRRGRDEVDEGAAGRDDRRQLQLVRRRAGCRSAPRAARVARVDRAQRVVGRAGRSRRPTAPCSSKRARANESGSRVHDQLDARPAGTASTCLRAMAAGAAEAELLEQRAERARGRVVDARTRGTRSRSSVGARRRIERARCVGAACAPRSPSVRRRRVSRRARLALEVEQRAHRVDGGAPVRRLAEHVVEDLERQRPGVAGAQHLLEEVSTSRTGPGPGSCGSAAPTAARPSPGAARRPSAGRRSCSPGIAAMPAGSSLQRQGVEAVEDQAEVRMVGALRRCSQAWP